MNYFKTHSKKLGVFILLLLMATTYACSDLTSNYNKNKDEPSLATTPNLLTNAQKSLSDQYWGEFPLGYFGNQYSQYWSQNQYTDESRYNYRPNVVNSIWEDYYLSLNTIQQIIRLNNEDADAQAQYGKKKNQIAIAKILKAFAYQNLTEIWGAIPFGSDALKGAENTTPEYTSQKEVYEGILKMLTEASESIDTGSKALASGDAFYGGDMEQWKKLANSLKLRVAIRLVDANRGMAQDAIQGFTRSDVITDNDDNALLTYKSTPNNNPINEAYKGRDDFAVSNTLIDFMKGNDDPRISAYAAKTYTAKDGSPLTDADGNDIPRPSGVDDYIGFPYGMEQGAATVTKGEHEWSRPSLRVRGEKAPAIFMTASEVLFSMAEARKEGLITDGSVSAYYDDAIDRSLEYWDVSTTPAFENSISYGASSHTKKEIAHQKWVALYMQGIQGWSVLRRVDIDFLNAPEGGQKSVTFDGDVAVRYPYPIDEKSLNGDNVGKAISNYLGGTDDQGQELWFQKESN